MCTLQQHLITETSPSLVSSACSLFIFFYDDRHLTAFQPKDIAKRHQAFNRVPSACCDVSIRFPDNLIILSSAVRRDELI